MEAKVSTQTPTGTEKNFNYNMYWKKTDVISVPPTANLKEVAQLMKDHQIGDVLVVGGGKPGQEVQGIVTDRDIALCLTEDANCMQKTAGDVMSESVVTASEGDDFFKLVELMHQSGVTRLPLKDANGKLVGVVTAKNLLQILARTLFEITEISEQQQENERVQQH